MSQGFAKDQYRLTLTQVPGTDFVPGTVLFWILYRSQLIPDPIKQMRKSRHREVR